MGGLCHRDDPHRPVSVVGRRHAGTGDADNHGMSRITEQSFVRSLQNKEVDVRALDRSLKAADINGDGVVSGAAESKALWKAIDDFDTNGSRTSVNSSAAPVARALAQVEGNARPARGIGSGSTTAPTAPGAPTTGRTVGDARGTGYFPDSSAMEGGFVDKQGKKLQTLNDYVSARQQHPNDPSKWPPYVSIALDKRLYQNGTVKYGEKFRIPELEKKFGMPIEFRAVDTGGAFTGKGFSRVDICTSSRKNSLDPTVNGHLTLVKQS